MVQMRTGSPTGSTAEQLDRRAELLAADDTSRSDASSAELDELTAGLAAVMRSDRLVVRRVDRSEPAEVLDRLVQLEPVHPFDGPGDLDDRLDDDRRCYVLEHPDLPGRPLNVVWCAMCDGVADDLRSILDPAAPTADPEAADTAVFYSIWNVEPGLVGLPGGRTLLVGAIAALRDELPGLRTFVTLSPIPGFRTWQEQRGAESANHERHDRDPQHQQELVAQCARYLVGRRNDGRPLDAVARFHLGNGARLWALCPGADRSERGMERSYGIMANYRYDPEDRAANRAELRQGRPALGDSVRALLDGDRV